MDADDLPTSIEELQRLLMESQSLIQAERQRTIVAEQQTVELTATIDKQKKQLDQFEFKIRELLQALRGKQRERIDPSQLMLFDIGELESFIEEQLDDGNAADEDPTPKKKKKRKRGRRLIPDHLPRVEIEHTLPADQRLCPHDGLPMPFIRWETSEQLDYIPGVRRKKQ
jgi:hypothetical protein